MVELLLNALVSCCSILLAAHSSNELFDLGQFLWITLLLLKVGEIFGKGQEIILDSLRCNNVSRLDELQGVYVHIDFTLVYSEPMAVETLGLHKSVKFFNHEGIVNWGHKLDVAMMAWAVV